MLLNCCNNVIENAIKEGDAPQISFGHRNILHSPKTVYQTRNKDIK